MNELKPYIVTVVEKYSRSVVVWAEDSCEAEDAAYNLCNDDVISLRYEDFTGRECKCDGEAQESGLSFYEQYGRKGDRK